MADPVSIYALKRDEHLETVRRHLERVKPDIHSKPKLTPAMEERYHTIRSMRDFQQVQGQFAADCQEGLITYDSETVRGKEHLSPLARLDSILIGGLSGRCYEFDIQPMRREARKFGANLSLGLPELLPPLVVDALQDPHIMKLGSDILADAENDFYHFELTVGPVVEMQKMYASVEREVFPWRTNKHGAFGLGSIAYSLFGANYKPRARNHPEAWASSMHWRLYDWRRPLSDYARMYRYLDSQVPLALVSKVTEDCLEKHLVSSVLVEGSLRPIREAIVRPYTAGEEREQLSNFLTYLVPKNPDDTAASRKELSARHDREKRRAELKRRLGPPLTEEQKRRRVEVVSEEEVLELHPNPQDLAVQQRTRYGSETVVITDQDKDWARGQEEGDEKVDYNRGGKKKSRRSRAAAFKRATREEQAENMFIEQPRLIRLCMFCGAGTHSIRDRSNEPLCSHFRTQLRRMIREAAAPLCDYPFCQHKEMHLLSACPEMHHRCSLCLLRGHRSKPCPKGATEVAQFRDVFERHADASQLLRRRFEESAWGFFASHPTTAQVEYRALLSMSVEEARERVKPVQ